MNNEHPTYIPLAIEAKNRPLLLKDWNEGIALHNIKSNLTDIPASR